MRAGHLGGGVDELIYEFIRLDVARAASELESSVQLSRWINQDAGS